MVRKPFISRVSTAGGIEAAAVATTATPPISSRAHLGEVLRHPAPPLPLPLPPAPTAVATAVTSGDGDTPPGGVGGSGGSGGSGGASGVAGAAFPAVEVPHTPAKPPKRAPCLPRPPPTPRTAAAQPAVLSLSCHDCGFAPRFCPCCGTALRDSDAALPPGQSEHHRSLTAPSEVGEQLPDAFALWAAAEVKAPRCAGDAFFWELSAADRVSALRERWDEASANERGTFEKLAAQQQQQQQATAAAGRKTKRGGLQQLTPAAAAAPAPKAKVKRAKSSFMLFCDAQRAGVVAALREVHCDGDTSKGSTQATPAPTIPLGDVAKELGRRWRELPAEEQARYAASATVAADGSAVEHPVAAPSAAASQDASESRVAPDGGNSPTEPSNAQPPVACVVSGVAAGAEALGGGAAAG